MIWAIIWFLSCIYCSYFFGAVFFTSFLYFRHGYFKLNYGKSFYIFMFLGLLTITFFLLYPHKHSFKNLNRMIVYSHFKYCRQFKKSIVLTEKIQHAGFRLGWVFSFIATPYLFLSEYSNLLN